MIEGYAVDPVRREVAKELEAASRCFRRECSLLDHADRGKLMEIYNGWVDRDMFSPAKSSKPSDEELLDRLLDVAICRDSPYLEELDESPKHEKNRIEWPLTVGEIFSESNRTLFRERFGLDIWYSFARLPHHEDSEYLPDFGFPQATITFLTLPNPGRSDHHWAHSTGIVDLDRARIIECNHSENGFGVAVEFRKRPSAEELDRFSKASKLLKLQAFAYSSHAQDHVLQFEPSDISIDSETTHGSKDSDKLHVST